MNLPKGQIRGNFQRTIREDKTFYNFILAFFRFQGILYTRIGIDELENLEVETSKLMQDYFIQID